MPTAPVQDIPAVRRLIPEGERPSVLVTSGRSRVAYGMVRSLALRGIPVYVADSSRTAMSFFSRYVRGRFVCPSPFSSPGRFIDFINRIGEQHGITVLMPAMEETYTIAKLRSLLRPEYRLALMDYGSLIGLHDKSRWTGLAQDAGVFVPRTLALADALANGCLLDRLSYPVLLKPKQGGGGWGVTRIETPSDLAAALASPLLAGSAPDRFYLQEQISGETVCVAMIYDHGRMVGKVAYRQLRTYPQPFGQATLRETVRNAEAEAALQRMLDRVRWHGVCQADFVVERGAGKPYLVDLNPRFWGSVALGVAAGVDFPWLAYRIALGEEVSASEEFRSGIYSRWLWGDVAATVSQLRSGLPRRFNRQGGEMHYDDFTLRDPLPFLGWLVDVAGEAMSGALRGARKRDALLGTWE